MNKTKEIDFEEINKVLYYDESSPSGLRWARSKGKKGKAAVAGTLQVDKRYWKVQVNSRQYLAHRIVYLLQYMRLPSHMEIDHIDGNSLNNKIENLRVVNRKVNTRNKKQQRNNTTGFTGVCYEITRGLGYYRAHYCDPQGKVRRKSFSCNKYGAEVALELACKWRTEMLEGLNKILGDERYTNRHGIE